MKQTTLLKIEQCLLLVWCEADDRADDGQHCMLLGWCESDDTAEDEQCRLLFEWREADGTVYSTAQSNVCFVVCCYNDVKQTKMFAVLRTQARVVWFTGVKQTTLQKTGSHSNKAKRYFVNIRANKGAPTELDSCYDITPAQL